MYPRISQVLLDVGQEGIHFCDSPIELLSQKHEAECLQTIEHILQDQGTCSIAS